jgi:hypothetical protein
MAFKEDLERVRTEVALRRVMEGTKMGATRSVSAIIDELRQRATDALGGTAAPDLSPRVATIAPPTPVTPLEQAESEASPGDSVVCPICERHVDTAVRWRGRSLCTECHQLLR